VQYTLFTHTSIRTLTRAEQRLFWLQYKYLAYLHNPTIFFGPLLFVVPFVSCGIPARRSDSSQHDLQHPPNLCLLALCVCAQSVAIMLTLPFCCP